MKLKHAMVIVPMLAYLGVNTTPHAAPADEPEAGSPEAARSVVLMYLQLQYDAPARDTAIGMPVIQGQHARVNATTPSKKCAFELVRNEQANRFGWTIQRPTCDDIKQKGAGSGERADPGKANDQ